MLIKKLFVMMILALTSITFAQNSNQKTNNPAAQKEKTNHMHMMSKNMLPDSTMNNMDSMMHHQNMMSDNDSCSQNNNCCGNKKVNQKKSEHMNMNSSNIDMMSHDKNHDKMNTNIVRKGVIDLKAIDKNKDGFVYQDMMDWNVISDVDGSCPVCGMKLRKVTLEQCKSNLEKHNFKVR